MANKTDVKDEKIKELQNELMQIKKQVHTDYANINKFSNVVQKMLWDTSKGTKTSSVTFNSYSKKDILGWLESPEANAKELRDASINKYNTSTHYQRLIHYYAGLVTWAYTLSPTRIDPDKINAEKLKKNYTSTLNKVETWNLKHELLKAAIVALREDVFYGVEDSTKDSFHIVKINPDICVLTDIVDGCFRFGIDMSKISVDEVILYPKVVQDMYKVYERTGESIQLVPESVCWCLKFKETIEYPIPPFISTLIDLCDIDDYKALQLARTEIQNYKALSMKVPVDEDGVPLIEWDMVMQYYAQVATVLPDYVGLITTPMDIESFNFELSGGLNDVDTVSTAEKQFWSATGTSSLLFGDAKNNSAGALKLSIRADEELMYEFMTQCERLVNRRLKFMPGTIKFKINFLPVSVYNYFEMVELYTKAIGYGYPVKRAAGAVIGLTADDLQSQTFLENEVLDITSQFVPVSTSHTQSGLNREISHEGLNDISTSEEYGE